MEIWEKYWSGAATEGKPRHDSVRNPFTAAFSYSEANKLLSSFTDIHIKKVGATLNEVPFFGRRLKKFFMKFRTTKLYKDAGIMRVGAPIYAGYLPIEKKVEKYIGWNLDITGVKPIE